jgi:pimeloyl-ACP methyl ester carboxylesterase
MERQIDLGDAKIAFDRFGKGPAVLFVHGFPFDRSMWRSQVRALSHLERLVPDLRGLGNSELGAGVVTMASYADDLIGLLDRWGLKRVIVCGLSMGGYVALEIMRRHPERVRGLVLMDTRAEGDSPEARQARDDMAAAASEGMGSIFREMAPRLLAEGTTERRPKVVGELRAMILGAPVPGVLAALRAMRERADARDWLGEIRVPTLVVVGAEDRVTPVATATDLARRISEATLAIVPGAGHLPPLERPHLTTRLLADFVSRVG